MHNGPNCPNCTDIEKTVAHFIGQCPVYPRVRGDTLGTYNNSINDIMNNNNIDLIINFALKTLYTRYPIVARALGLGRVRARAKESCINQNSTTRLLKKEDKDDIGVT